MQILNKLSLIPRKLRIFFYKRFNYLLFKSVCTRVGKNFLAYNRVYISVIGGGKAVIGDDCIISSGENINPLSRNIRTSICVEDAAVLTIGDHVGISSACIWSKDNIRIGNNVMIGANSVIMDSDAHSLDADLRLSTEKVNGVDINVAKAKKSPIIIEDNVLIGTNVIILKGVTIGRNSVIGAGSVVSKSIPADTIAAGNPCKIIKQI